MGILGAETDSDDTGGSSSSTNSSSGEGTSRKRAPSNPSPSDFPIYTMECPQLLIQENDEGELEALRYPQTPEVELRKDWYGENWTVDTPSEHWVRWWFSETSLRNLVNRVEEQTGQDLFELLREDVEYALETIKATANPDAVAPEWYKSNCPVCGETIHARYDEHEVINHERVCQHHSAKELAEADLFQ